MLYSDTKGDFFANQNCYLSLPAAQPGKAKEKSKSNVIQILSKNCFRVFFSKFSTLRRCCFSSSFTLGQISTNRPNMFHRAYRYGWGRRTIRRIGCRKDQNLGSMLHDILFKIISFIVLILWKLKVNEIQDLFSVSLCGQKKRNVNVCYSYSRRVQCTHLARIKVHFEP